MMNSKLDELRRLVETLGGSMSNFERTLFAYHPDVRYWVISATPFLPDGCKFNERVYCLIHGIEDRKLCPITGEPLSFINFFKGYRLAKGRAKMVLMPGEEILSNDDIDFLRSLGDAVIAPEFRKRYPDLVKRIMASTAEFGDARLPERLYCILNGIEKRPKAQFQSFFVGYPRIDTTVTRAYRRKNEFQQECLKYAALVGSENAERGRLIRKFVLRNRERNAALYDLPADAEGTDFIVCPATAERVLNIKRPYVENVLGMTWDEFRQRYPDAKVSCDGLKRRIAAGVNAIGENGLTKHEVAIAKATETWKQVGDDGLTSHERRGKKTRAAHMRRGDDGLTGYQRLAKYRNETVLENGLTIQQNALLKRYAKAESTKRRQASKMSIVALQPVLDHLTAAGLRYFFGEQEYCLRDGDHAYFFDLVVPELGVCVEYQSKAFHPNPAWNDTEWNGWRHPYHKQLTITPDEKYEYDILKAKSLWRNRAIATWFVWQESAAEDVAMIMEYLHEIEQHLRNTNARRVA